MEIFGVEWLAAAANALADLPEVEGADAVIDYVVAGGPGGKVTIAVTVEGGRVASIVAGKSPEPDIVVSAKYDDVVSILEGELSADAGYMNAALKVEGAHKRWLLDLRDTRRAAIEAMRPVMDDTTT